MKILLAIRDFFVAVFEVLFCSKHEYVSTEPVDTEKRDDTIEIAKIIAKNGTCVGAKIWCKANKTQCPEGLLICPGMFCAGGTTMKDYAKMILKHGQS